MGGAIVGGQTGAVHAEYHRQVLEGDIVHDAIVSALQEGGVNGADRMEPHRGHARGRTACSSAMPTS